MALASRITRFPPPPPSSEKFLDDNRFRALLPPEEWGRLPVATWRRFSKRLGPGRTIVYAGEIEEAAFSRIGWWLAQVTGSWTFSTRTGLCCGDSPRRAR